MILRGTSASPWELAAWEPLQDDYEILVAVPPNNQFDLSLSSIEPLGVRTVGGAVPDGALRRATTKLIGERYIGLNQALEGADIVHAAELGYWFSAQAARVKPDLGFKLVVTVWETIPFMNSYRNIRTRPYRSDVLGAADLFLAATERAKKALLLEGAPPEDIRVSYPGIDAKRYAECVDGERAPNGEHLILSIGRLVWEKGHQDVIRAVAELHHSGRRSVRLLIVGVGPEEKRLRALVSDLGLVGKVDFRGWVPHEALPRLYAQASCLVLASLPTMYWEEQFGMVIAEALASRLPVIAADSGAIPEVLDGEGALFPAGDWLGLSRELEVGPLSTPPGTRSAGAPELVARYSSDEAAGRLSAAYEEVLGRKGTGRG